MEYNSRVYIKFCKKDIEEFKPDGILLIDYPGFNLRIAEWAKEKGLYTEIFNETEEMDAAILTLSEKLANSNPQAMSNLKKIFWEGTENWDNLIIERAEISGKLVLSDFTISAINQFKKK